MVEVEIAVVMGMVMGLVMERGEWREWNMVFVI